MRGEGDYRPDTTIKKEMLTDIRAQGYDVRLVVDDRPSVVEMWKAEGLTVLAHDSGEWEGEKAWEPGALHMMVGPAGAGKSWYVESYFFFRTNYTRPRSALISSDALRIEITGDMADQSANTQVFSALHAQVKARVESGLTTIVDATNIRARDRRAVRDLCPAETPIFYHIIDRPLDEKHRDAGWRAEVEINGVKLIDKHHQSFRDGLKAILAGDDDPRVTVYDHRR
jgi:predicted kinase